MSGRLGALLGDEVVEAGPGAWVFKPRRQWHTFWNAGKTPCHIIEIISPAGLKNYFREIAEALKGDDPQLGQINEKYEVEMGFNSFPKPGERFGLTNPEF